MPENNQIEITWEDLTFIIRSLQYSQSHMIGINYPKVRALEEKIRILREQLKDFNGVWEIKEYTPKFE